MKFVNSGTYDTYKANIMILSGDLTGKAIVPIIRNADGSYIAYGAQVLGQDLTARSQKELKELESRVRNAGCYVYATDPQSLQELEGNASKRRALFNQLMLETLQRWISIAEERLRPTGKKLYIMPGNDDIPEAGSIIKKSDFATNPESQVVELDQFHKMISIGYSNPTPWKTPRECSEEQLWEMISKAASQLDSYENTVFNLHCPPYDSGLDTAPKLDENLRPEVTMGDLVRVPVGSTSVRTAIEKYQPLCSLHGHVHESPGMVQIGRTVCVNPGSEYQSGILRGYIVDLERGKIRQCLRVET